MPQISINHLGISASGMSEPGARRLAAEVARALALAPVPAGAADVSSLTVELAHAGGVGDEAAGPLAARIVAEILRQLQPPG